MESDKKEIKIAEISNLSELQSKIIKVIQGYPAHETVHAFEVIKLAILTGKEY